METNVQCTKMWDCGLESEILIINKELEPETCGAGSVVG